MYAYIYIYETKLNKAAGLYYAKKNISNFFFLIGSIFFFFLNFIYGCVGSSFLCEGFL